VFETPVVSTNTSFWASATQVVGGEVSFGGPQNRSTNGQFHTNTDFYPLFTANQAFTIRSVKVYANGAGARTIALIDRTDGSTLATGTFTLPDGESRVQPQLPSAGPGQLRPALCGGKSPVVARRHRQQPRLPLCTGLLGRPSPAAV
jgi:hypothetical protein